MKTLAKTLLQGFAVITVGMAVSTFDNACARQNNYQQQESYDDENNQDDNNGGYNQPSENSDNEEGEGEEQGSSAPTLQVQVNMNMTGEYRSMFNKEKGKFQIFLRALNDTKNSTKGSKPVKLDLNGGDATFEPASVNDSIDEPKGVLVAITKVGNTYQYFCNGKGIKAGVITGFPQGINITLTNGNKPYKTAANKLRNDAYPNCQVEVAN